MSSRAELPPAIELLLDEDLEGIYTPGRLVRTLKKLGPELIRQSRWAKTQFSYVDVGSCNRTPAGAFQVRASGALDPFSSVEICESLACRIHAAEQFARTAGMLADTVVIPDLITPAFADIDHFDEESAARLLGDLIVLDRLKPLIASGVITFSDARLGYCQHHNREAYDRVVEVTDALLRDIESELMFERISDTVVVRTRTLFNQPMMFFHAVKEEDRSKSTREIGLKVFRRPLIKDIAALVRDMRSAERIGATLASASRIGLLAIKRIEQRAPEVSSLENWEAMRSVDLPWIRNLAPEDVVRLREEAATALPRLRGLLHVDCRPRTLILKNMFRR